MGVGEVAEGGELRRKLIGRRGLQHVAVEAAQQEALSTFQALAGCDADFAQSFLAANGWNLEMAVQAFCGEGGGAGAANGGVFAATSSSSSSSSRVMILGGSLAFLRF